MYTSVIALVAMVGVAQCVVVLKEAAYLRLRNRNNQTTVNSRTARESAFDENTNFLYVVG